MAKLSRFAREKMAAEFGIEFMTLRQTTRGWSKLKGSFGHRRTWSIVGRGWMIYFVLADTKDRQEMVSTLVSNTGIGESLCKKVRVVAANAGGKTGMGQIRRWDKNRENPIMKTIRAH